jgi:hypothetical protein
MQFRVTFARAIGALGEPTADQHEVNSAANTVCAAASVAFLPLFHGLVLRVSSQSFSCFPQLVRVAGRVAGAKSP